MQKHADYVIFLGQVFRWEEKEPFEVSGCSIKGGLEYDKEADKIKCHECGEWYRGLSGHTHADAQYREKHCLRKGDSLCSPGLQKILRERANMEVLHIHFGGLGTSEASKRGHAVQEQQRKTETCTPRMAPRANFRGHCPAQLLEKLRIEAKKQGRTPTPSTVEPWMIGCACKAYGSWSSACYAAGLEPNRKGDIAIYSQSSLVESLRDFWALNGRLPKAREFGSGRLPSQTTYRRNFGTLANAFEAAGLSKVAESNAAD